MTERAWQRRVEERLIELRAELVEGERAVRELDARRDRLVASMLRIGGAIQVLEELVAAPAAEPAASVVPAGALPEAG
jgi:hypothetical protein